MFRQEKNGIYRLWFTIFFISFLAGVLFMNLCSESFLNEEGIFNPVAMSRMKYMEVDHNSFFRYVLPMRIKPFLLLGLISTTCIGILAGYFCIVWQGLMTGMIITAALIRFGMKGLLLILAGVFPQQLLLIPAGIMMLSWCYQNCCFLYFPHKCMWPGYKSRQKQYLRQAGVLLWIFGVVIIGCILECYVNPILISDLIKIF